MINDNNGNLKPDTRGATGRIGEAYAAQFLQQKGYEILRANARVGRLGEIDIVAREKNILVFVEVKTRHSELFGLPQEAVNFRKQKKLCQCAMLYLKQMNMKNKAFRFDVVAVLLNKDDTVKRMEVIQNAF